MSIPMKLIVGTVLAILSLTALAHPDPAVHGHGFGVWSGITHPLSGPDHLAVLVLLGVWMHRSGAGWRAAACPIAALTAGVALSGIGLSAGLVEALVLASLPVAAFAVVRGNAAPGMVALLALMMGFHGLAHGAAGAAGLTSAFAAGLGFGSLAVVLTARLASGWLAIPGRGPATRPASSNH